MSQSIQIDRNRQKNRSIKKIGPRDLDNIKILLYKKESNVYKILKNGNTLYNFKMRRFSDNMFLHVLWHKETESAKNLDFQYTGISLF